MALRKRGSLSGTQGQAGASSGDLGLRSLRLRAAGADGKLFMSSTCGKGEASGERGGVCRSGVACECDSPRPTCVLELDALTSVHAVVVVCNCIVYGGVWGGGAVCSAVIFRDFSPALNAAARWRLEPRARATMIHVLCARRRRRDAMRDADHEHDAPSDGTNWFHLESKK